MSAGRRQLALAIGSVLLSASISALAEQNEVLDNILVSKVNGITTLQIWPGCELKYVDHTPSEAGMELRIRVEAGSDCDEILTDFQTEVYLPLGRRMGKVNDITFDALNKRDTFITLHFTEPQKFQVKQHTVGWIEVFVDTTVASASLPPNVPPPLVKPAPAAPKPRVFAASEAPPRTAPTRRQTPTRQNVPTSSQGDFVVQLGVFESPELATQQLLRSDTEHFAYTTSFEINGKTWHGLQVGFFNSEADAERVLQNLQRLFPDSWVRYVQPDEASTAKASGGLRAASTDQVPAVRIDGNAAATDGELRSLMASARQALIERRYADAVRDYTRVLQVPNHPYRPQAREYLGVAHERNRQIANAIAEYQAFIAEFPNDDNLRQVQGRLTALETAIAFNDAEPQRGTAGRSGEWELFGGVSQYYWRNQEQLVHDGNHVVSASGLLALGDVTASRRGERFDVLARFNGAYQFNLVEFDDAGDIGWVSDAYIDVVDTRWDLQGRFGRQTQRGDGVLGRFDGASLKYQWKPDISFGVSAGFPIDSPRFISESHRVFYAASATVENLWDKIDVSAFTHQQTVDGIQDRQAVGGEVEYQNGPLSVVGLVDYDLSYAVLNTALVNGTWYLDNDWTINARFDFGALPYLTTRNALMGQSVASVDELLDTYTEGQVRTLARDRTAQAFNASFGITVPLSERFRVSFDVASRQADETVASGGVAAIPETGSQFFVNATLVGTNLLRENDLNIITLRHDSTRTRDTSTVVLDTRLPFGRGLRINPRVGVSQISMNEQDSDQFVVRPAIRLLYRWRDLLLDLEFGGTWSNRELPPAEWDPFTPDGTEELTGGYVNLGYRWEF